MRYVHRYRINASQASVAAFHQQPRSLGAITPPPVRVELKRAPETLSGGGEMAFTLWLGPLPIHWAARIEHVSEAGFTDRQVSGPFAEWVHRHTFVKLDEDTTEVADQITLQLKANLLWGFVGLGFVIGLPVLFAFRAWKTRHLLEKRAAS